jgi:EAL domain-containing protein (putative c-di-GMP-specific phosphodiesterase class I)
VTISHRAVDELVQDALASVRTLLGMEVAFLSEFCDGRRIFRYVDNAADEIPVRVAGSDPLEDSYCQRVVDGRLPELMRDASANAHARTIPATAIIPVGAHLSVPVRLSDGRIYGTFCCFSRRPDESLGERDVSTMRCFANMTAKFIEEQVAEERRHRELITRYQRVLEDERFAVAYQPIVRLADSRVVGYEALARFPDPPQRTPDVWFNEAAAIGLQGSLEVAVVRKALRLFALVADAAYVSLNASPQTILSGALAEALLPYPCARIVLEVTEHASVDDYASIARAIDPLRRRGMRLAVDDAGAGYASFRHILKLQPELIKLDTSLIRQIDKDRQSRALAAAIVRFSEEAGSRVVAEGVETEAELAVLRDLGIELAQGYLLGRPAPLESWLPPSSADAAPANGSP